jgi:hypothetical protein
MRFFPPVVDDFLNLFGPIHVRGDHLLDPCHEGGVLAVFQPGQEVIETLAVTRERLCDSESASRQLGGTLLIVEGGLPFPILWPHLPGMLSGLWRSLCQRIERPPSDTRNQG